MIQNLDSWTSNNLIDAYVINSDLVEQFWAEGNNSCGDDIARAFGMMHECQDEANQIGAEIKRRRAAGTLYDGRIGEIRALWAWAKTKTDDEEHRYNMVRSAMRKKGIELLPLRYSGLFN